MPKVEEILDQAIKRLSNGEEISSILLSCPKEMREQLSANLHLAKIGMELPKRAAPSPLKRKLYLRVEPQSKLSRIAEFLSIYALALPVLVVMIAAGISYAAAQSIPGDKLFAVKLSYEKLQLKLAANPEQQAKLQLNFANSRLAEVEKTLTDKNYNQTDQAIEELNNQTQAALNNIKQIAASNPDAKKDLTLIDSVKSLANNQAQLVTKVSQTKPDPQIAAAAQKTVENIEQLIATTSDQTAAAIPANQSINVTGQISALTENSITIEKNVFTIDSKTAFRDKDGNQISLGVLTAGDTVQIQGQVQNQTNLAISVTLIAVKPIQTLPIQNELKTSPKPAPKPANSDDSAVPAKPQDVSSGFIPEAAENPTSNQ